MNNTHSKIRVGLLFGGRSKEHEVSVLSALSVLEAMNPKKYEVIPIRITKQGRWKLLPGPKVLKTIQDWENHPGRSAVLMPTGEGGGLVCPEQVETTQGSGVDVVFPLLHGVFGEDGTVQGMLAMAGVAYVGAEVLGSALGMDKIWMKLAFKEAGLNPVPFWWFHRKTWQDQPDRILSEIEKRFPLSLFYQAFEYRLQRRDFKSASPGGAPASDLPGRRTGPEDHRRKIGGMPGIGMRSSGK